MNMIADPVIQRYRSAACAEHWKRNGHHADEDQNLIQLLRDDPQMRTTFIDAVAAADAAPGIVALVITATDPCAAYCSAKVRPAAPEPRTSAIFAGFGGGCTSRGAHEIQHKRASRTITCRFTLSPPARPPCYNGRDECYHRTKTVEIL